MALKHVKRYKAKCQYESGFYLLSRLMSEYVMARLGSISLAVLCMLLVSVTTAINAWLMQPVLDEIFLKRDSTMLYLIPLAIIANAVVKCSATFYQTTKLKIVGQSILAEIQLQLYGHLIYSDMKFLTEYPSGNLISRFTNDINAMRKTVTDVVSVLIVDLFTVIGLIAVMVHQSVQLALIALLVLPLAFFPLRQLGKKMRKAARGMQEELADFTVRLDETFQNIKIIKSYCREEYEISRAARIIDRFLEIYHKAAFIESASSPMMEMLGGIIVAAVIVFGGSQVIEGVTTPGAFFSFIASLLMLYKPLKTLSNLNTALQEGLTASRRFFTMLDEKPEIVHDESLVAPKFANYNIRFLNVYFSYKPNKKILEGINISIPQGKTVALVGSSGSGKTTIFNLLQRLYDPNFGIISIDGHDIKDIPLRSLRQLIGLVSQEITLFDDTIRENIRYGRLDATEEEIVDAAMAAAAHDFIVDLPDGYDTQIGQQGVKLSGGQRQRIAIARAMLKNAPILLLDEATSALDAISEKQVQMALEYLKKGRTTIVIAHRLSTIENADLIYVVSDGVVQEYGTHQELLEKGNEYTLLYQQYKEEKTFT